jgi:hypothetical protein
MYLALYSFYRVVSNMMCFEIYPLKMYVHMYVHMAKLVIDVLHDANMT